MVLGQLSKIHARSFTSNVVGTCGGERSGSFVARPRRSCVMRQCSGNTFDPRAGGYPGRKACRGILHGSVPKRSAKVLSLAWGGDTFSFAHDRIQQGTYGMMREDMLSAEHLRAGRLLLAGIPEDELDENLFAVLDQYNKGRALIASAEERARVARLNYRAGQKARQMTAFDLAYQVLRAGIDLLEGASWENEYDPHPGHLFRCSRDGLPVQVITPKCWGLEGLSSRGPGHLSIRSPSIL